MRYLADESIPLEAIEQLRAAGLDVASTSEQMAGAGDTSVLEAANREGRMLITFDKDFAELVFREHKETVAGIVLLRIRPRSARSVAEILVRLLTSKRRWQDHFSVVTESQIRMVPLPRR